MPRMEMELVRWLPTFQLTLAARLVMSSMPTAPRRSISAPWMTEMDSGTSCSFSMRLRLRTVTALRAWVSSAGAAAAALSWAKALPAASVAMRAVSGRRRKSF